MTEDNASRRSTTGNSSVADINIPGSRDNESTTFVKGESSGGMSILEFRKIRDRIDKGESIEEGGPLAVLIEHTMGEISEFLKIVDFDQRRKIEISNPRTNAEQISGENTAIRIGSESIEGNPSSGVGLIRDRTEAGVLSIEENLDEPQRRLRAAALGEIDQFNEFDECQPKREIVERRDASILTEDEQRGFSLLRVERRDASILAEDEHTGNSSLRVERRDASTLIEDEHTGNSSFRVERRDASILTEDEQRGYSSLRVERRDPATQESQTDVVEEEGLQEALTTTEPSSETEAETRAHNDGRERVDGNNENADGGQPEVQTTTTTSEISDANDGREGEVGNNGNADGGQPGGQPGNADGNNGNADGGQPGGQPEDGNNGNAGGGQPGGQRTSEIPGPGNDGAGVINIARGTNPSNEVPIFILNPHNRLYRFWSYFIIILAVCSSFFTPLEFAFFTDLPEGLLYIIDLVVAFFFFVDHLVQFLIHYRDDQADRMVYRHRSIALRYLKSPSTYYNLLVCSPWDFIYAVCWRYEGVRFFLWIRLYRVSKVVKFFQNIEINDKVLRILKHLMILFYYIHTAGCIFYYLATIVPDSYEGYTWLGSFMLGQYSYSHFRQICLGRRYLISLYFALVTMSTVGYGDVHPVSAIEMIFTMIYISLSLVVLPYWLKSALSGI